MPFVSKRLNAHAGLSHHVNKAYLVFSRTSCIDSADGIDNNFVLTLPRCEEENCSRAVTCSRRFDGCSQRRCSFTDTCRRCSEMMPSSFECTETISNHLKLTGSCLFVSKVRNTTSLNWVLRLTHNVRTMTTPLKDSVESLRYLESVVSQSGVYDTCGDPAVKRLAWNRCPPGRHPGGCGGRGVGVHGGRVVQDGHVHVS